MRKQAGTSGITALTAIENLSGSRYNNALTGVAGGIAPLTKFIEDCIARVLSRVRD